MTGRRGAFRFAVIACFSVIAPPALAAGGDEVEPRPVFVPRADLAVAVERSGSGLTLAYREFRALARAAAESRFHELVPSLVTGAALTSLAAEARVADSGELAIEVEAVASVLRPGLAALALPAAGAVLVSAEVDGEAAATAVVPGEAPVVAVFLRGIGEHAVKLSYVAAVRRDASGRAGVRFTLPRAALATLRLAVPGAREIAARSGAAAAESAGDPASPLSLRLDGREIAIDWLPRDAAPATPYVEAEATLSVRATPDLLSGLATIRVRSTAPLGESVRVRWPADLSLTETSGPSVAAFEAAPGLGGDGTTVDVAVRLVDPRATEATFSTRFERVAASPGEIVVPSPEFPGAARSSAVVRVESDEIHAVAVLRSAGTRRLALDEKRPSEREAFAAEALPFSLVLGVAEAPDAAAAETGTSLSVEPGLSRLSVTLRVTAGLRPLAEAAGAVPDGFAVESADIQGSPGALHAEVVPGDAGAARLVLRFDPPLAPRSATSASVRLVRPERRLPETIELLPFRLEGVPPSDSALRLSASSRRVVIDRPGAALVKAADTAPSGEALDLAWIAPREGGDVRLAVEISEPEPRVEATIAEIAAPFEEKIVITAGARFDVTRGAADRFRVELPEGTTDHLDVTPLGALRLKESFKTREAGRDVWTFAVSERREGPVECFLRFEIARAPGARDAVASLPLPLLRARDVVRERLFVAVESSPEIDVAPAASGLDILDLASFPEVASVRPGRPLLHAYAAPRRDAALSLAIRAREALPVPAIAAASAIAECAVDEGGLERTRLLLRVRNAGAQHMSLAFPDDARLLTATVGGRAVKPLAGASPGVVLVPVPVTPGDGETVEVEVIAERRGRPLRAAGAVEIVLPGTDAVVLASELRLYLPPGHLPIAIDGTYSGGTLLGESDRPLVVTLALGLLAGVSGPRSGIMMRSESAPAATPAVEFADETEPVLGARRRGFDAGGDAQRGLAAAPPPGRKGLLPITLAFAATGRRENLDGIGLGRVFVRLLSERADRGLVVIAAALGFLLPFALARRGFGTVATALVLIVLASVLPALLPPLATRYLNGLAAGAFAALAARALAAIARRLARLVGPGPSALRGRRRPAPAAPALVLVALFASAADGGETPARPLLPPSFEDAFFVPYDPASLSLRSGPSIGDDDPVYVPRALYLRLWNRAHPEGTPGGDAPPGDALVSRASLVLEVGPEEARVAARFAIAVLEEERFEDVVFPFARATIESATLDGRPAALRALPDVGFALALEARGVHEVEIRFSVALGKREDGARLLALDLPPCPATRAVLVPAEGLVLVSAGAEPPAVLVESRGADGRRAARIDLGAARRLEAAFREALAPGAPGGAAFEAAVATRYRIAPGRAEIAATADVTVLSGSPRELAIALDPSIRVRGVEAPGLASHEIAESGGLATLTLRFEPPLAGTRRILVRGVAAIDDRDFALPAVTVPLAARETAYAAVAVEEGIRLALVAGEALEQVAPEDVRPSLPPATPPDLAYRLRRTAGTPTSSPARFSALPIEARLEADFVESVSFSRGRLSVSVEWTLRATGEPAFEASIVAPAGLETISVESRPPGLVASRREAREEPDGEGKRVFLRFARALPKECVLVARFERAASGSVAVPFPRIEGARPSRGRVVASADSSLRLAEESASGLVSIAAPGGARLSWSVEDAAAAALALRVEEEPSRLSAVSFTALTVGEERVEARATVLFRVEEGETDRFEMAVEGEADGPIDVAVDGLRRVTVAPDSGSGSRAIEVETRAPRRGEVRVDVRFDAPRAADGVYRLPVVRALGTRDAAPALGALLSAARGEIRPRLDGGAAAVAGETARRRLPGIALPRDATVFEIAAGAALVAEHVAFTVEETLEASISDLSLTTRLVDADASGRGVVLTRARFTIQNRREQYLALRLPEGALLLGASVDEAAVRPVSGAPEDPLGILLPLRKTSPGDTSYTAEIVWSERTERPLSRLGRFRPGAPAVSNMAVQRTYWTILSEPGFTLAIDGNMTEIPEAVELAERAERILSEQKILLGYLDMKSDSLRSRALENFAKNQQRLEDTLRHAESQQRELDSAARQGQLAEGLLELSIDNATNIRKTRAQSQELAKQVLLVAPPADDDTVATAEPDPGAALADAAKPASRPAAGREGEEKERGKKALKENEAAERELHDEKAARLEALGYPGAARRDAAGERLETVKSLLGERRRSGLKTVAIPFPEGGPARTASTWKKLEGAPALDVELERAAAARPVLAAAAVLAGALFLLLARRHWRSRHREPSLSAP